MNLYRNWIPGMYNEGKAARNILTICRRRCYRPPKRQQRRGQDPLPRLQNRQAILEIHSTAKGEDHRRRLSDSQLDVEDAVCHSGKLCSEEAWFQGFQYTTGLCALLAKGYIPIKRIEFNQHEKGALCAVTVGSPMCFPVALSFSVL